MLGDHALAKAERVPAIHSSFPAQSHHCVRAVLIEVARPTLGTRARRVRGNPAPSTAPADPREQGYGIGERPWRRRQLGRCSGQHCQVSVEQNFGPCQERYQRRSIGFKPEGVISPSGANVPDRVGKRGIRQGRTSNFATAMWVDRLQHVNRRPNGNPPESGLSD